MKMGISTTTKNNTVDRKKQKEKRYPFVNLVQH